MQPWIIDANNIQVEDIEQSSNGVLCSTSSISNFLLKSNKTKMIVVAPKGYGKTLLLKAKRVNSTGIFSKVLPENTLLDKPGTVPSVVKTKEYDTLRSTENYWKSLWLMSITICVLKSFEISLKEPKGNRGTIGAIWQEQSLVSACDIFDRILSCGVNDYHSAKDYYNKTLLPSFRLVHSSAALFIDNIDEYFEYFLREGEATGISGTVSKSFWHFAQIGAALASRELNGLNNHIKVFVSIRKEVFQKSFLESPVGLQLSGASVELLYSQVELKQIIRNNIGMESPNRLVYQDADNPVERFFGRNCLRVIHPSTGDEEAIEDFWLRHTLGRPREIAAIGECLSNILPNDRNEKSVRIAVRETAANTVLSYLGEMAPHIEGIDPPLILSLIEKNVLTLDDLNRISKRYVQAFNVKHGFVSVFVEHIFCGLFKLGLLGYVRFEPDLGKDIQVFRRPGEEPLDRTAILPQAKTFLIHPVLDDAIARLRPDYLRHLHRKDIVGAGRLWRPKRMTSFVLKGDVQAFSKIMSEPVASDQFAAFFSETVEEECGQLAHRAVSDGDSVTLIDENPRNVLNAAKRVQEKMSQSSFACKMRFAGDAGFIEVDRTLSPAAIRGLAIRTAARLEPHVRAGHIFVTDNFIKEADSHLGTGNIQGFLLGPEDIVVLPYVDGLFNIAKSAKEDAIYTRLFDISRQSLDRDIT